jgi:hypothetical protein
MAVDGASQYARRLTSPMVNALPPEYDEAVTARE